MGFLKFVFDVVAFFPLINPDGGWEAELLMSGSKPVGLLVDSIPREGVIELYSEIAETVKSGISILDHAVREGSLNKQKFEFEDKQSGRRTVWNFYCQIGNESEMSDLAEMVLADLEKREPSYPVEKDYGELLGYSKADIWLFSVGGYNALPKPVNKILSATHHARKRCRIASKLNNEFLM